ncbi:MAG TPA: ATP-binding cassette domain-containing protein [Microthrixaceae bacterium]|nr:ATP-binding cassette domain-containing protein [Microthrixaceae bacterium]
MSATAAASGRRAGWTAMLRSAPGRAGLSVLAAAVLWVAAGALLPNGVPAGIVAIGAVLGSATGLSAVGVILVWRANRVVNFAAGALGGAAGLASVHLFLEWSWPYPVALCCAVLGGLVLGALVEVVVIRRFANAPRLVLTVATIGLAQVLGGLELALPKALFGLDAFVLGAFETPLTVHRTEMGPVVITGDHLLVAAVVPVVVAALAWFLRRSLAGTAIRAAAENTERARLLGIPVRHLTTVVWMVAGGLAALTFVLRAPFLGATPAAIAGPAVMLPALAAAVVARMESMPVAFGAAVALGVVDQVVRWNTASPELLDVVLLVVILGSLLATRHARSRAHDADGGWRDAELIRRLPAELARLPLVRAVKVAAAVLAVAAAVLVPMRVGPGTANSLSIMAVWGLVAVSLVVLTGWAGQISLGQFAFVGVGAIVAGNLVSRWDVDLFLTLLAACLAGALGALVLGVPALRIRGPFLAVVTLAFAVVLDGYVLNPNVFPDLIPQEVTRPLLWGRVDLEEERNMLWLCLAALALAVSLAAGVRRSRSGRLLIAARDNAKATESAAVSTRWTTLSGFTFAGALAGLAGGLHVLLLHGARVGSYQPVQSVEIFSMATIGGLGSLGGAIAGAAGMRGLQDLDDTIRLVVAGAGVLLVLWLVPSGLAGLAARIRDRVVGVVATPRRAGRPRGAEDGHRAEDPQHAQGVQPEVPAGDDGSTAPAAATGTSGVGLLAAEGIDVSYGRLQVLFEVDLQVGDGEIVALLGTNGAGKSTLLKAMCGLVPSSGEVRLGDTRISGRSPEQIVRDGVALMPGGRATFPTLTVDEHLRLASWTFRRDRERIEAGIEEVRALFPVLRERGDQLAGDLSGGEQQQLALAMTLLLRPRVLLIDELSLGLAPMVVGELCEVVRSLNRGGVTVVVVEQSVNVALTLAERAVFLEKGEVRFEGRTRELLERPDVLRSVFIEGAAAVDGRGARSSPSPNGTAPDGTAPVGAAPDGTAPADPLLPTGLVQSVGPVQAADPQPPGGPATADRAAARHGTFRRHLVPDRDDVPALECRGVTKRFGGVVALSDVDLVVQPGEIVGLIGQNGAGKTTLLDCISGFHELDGGTIRLRGVDVTGWAPFARARGRLARSFQEARLFPSLTVLETIQVACERSVTCRSLVADATRQPASYLSEAATGARALELARMLGLDAYAHLPTSALSTGTRRIVELACLLAGDPSVMLLDEPSAGVAQRETEALGPLLRRIRDHTGAALLVIEHDMPLLSGLCDRLVAMELGSVLVQGDPGEVLAHPAVVASYLGTDAAAVNRSGAAVPG